MLALPKISDAQKPAILACLKRLRLEAFGGSPNKTSVFLQECLGEFGVPPELQSAALSELLDQLHKTSPAENKPDEQPVEEAGPRIVSITFDSKPDMISIRTKDCENKPRKGGLIGRLLITTPTQKEVFVDSLKPNQMNGRKTLENAFGEGEHSLNVRTGDSVSFTIKFFDGSKTPPFKTKWQWKNI